MVTLQVKPDVLVVSTGKHCFCNDVVLTVSLGGTGLVTLSRENAILISLPLRTARSRRKAINTEVVVTAPEGWKVESCDAKVNTWRWRCYPTQPVALRGNEPLTFYFSELYLRHIDYPAGTLSLFCVHFGSEQPVYFPLVLKHAAIELSDFLETDSLRCGIGDDVWLAWRVSGDIYAENSRAWLMPGGLDALDASAVMVRARQTTTYMLYAQQAERIISRQRKVHVEPGKIKKFWASPENVDVDKAESVKLFAELENCNHAWLDHGIGRVSAQDLQRGVEVHPEKYQTCYTLMCEQYNGFAFANCMVTLNKKLTVKEFNITPCETALSRKYEICWEVMNARSVKICCDGNLISQAAQGRLYMYLPGAVSLYCAGEQGQKCEISAIPLCMDIL